MMNNEPTPVIFRTWKQGFFKGDVDAVFPTLPAGHHNYLTCYAHIGQHGECNWPYLQDETRLATPEEYADLKAELEAIGYNLKVMKRRPRNGSV